jgi:hypothetical protein
VRVEQVLNHRSFSEVVGFQNENLIGADLDHGLLSSPSVFIELEDSDAFWMDCFENGVNGELDLLVEDREIHLYLRGGNRSGVSIYRQSSVIAESFLWDR